MDECLQLYVLFWSVQTFWSRSFRPLKALFSVHNDCDIKPIEIINSVSLKKNLIVPVFVAFFVHVLDLTSFYPDVYSSDEETIQTFNVRFCSGSDMDT